MSKLAMSGEGGNYAPKLDSVLSKALTEYWNGLSKEEILTYLLHQPSVTADTLRTMLANQNSSLSIGVEFNLHESTAETDFYTDDK